MKKLRKHYLSLISLLILSSPALTLEKSDFNLGRAIKTLSVERETLVERFVLDNGVLRKAIVSSNTGKVVMFVNNNTNGNFIPNPLYYRK